jgi:hypothetical protein
MKKNHVKKFLFLIMLMLGIVFLVPAQSGGPIDLVVLLDTSASMSDFFRTTSDYLIGPFLREFLRIGDTFHLISFSSSPKVEISRRVEGVGDVETIIGRILLMYPLDPSSDLSGALSFAGNYLSSIPSERRKKIVLISDGDGNSAAVQSLITEASSRLTRQNTEFQYIRVPITGTPPSSGRPPVTAQPSRDQRPGETGSAAGSPAAGRPPVQPPSSGPVSQGQPPAQVPPAAGTAPAAPQARPTPPAVSQGPAGSGSGETPAAPPAAPPDSFVPQDTPPAVPPGGSVPQETPPVQAVSEEQPRQTPPAVPPSRQTPPEIPPQPVREAASSSGGIFEELPLPLIIGLGIAALLILGLLIFFAARKLHSSPNRAMAQAASAGSRTEEEKENQIRNAEMMSSFAESQKKSGTPPLSHPPPKPKPLPKDKPDNQSFESGLPMLSLFVEDQNTAIGRRNIHAVKSGYTFSVGGGKSDFLIFLVPIPPHIADVHFDGRQCTFIPRKSQYFPDIGSQEVPNCIGKTIRVISDKRYELHIRVERYEDPLRTLNKLLHSIAVPGEVSR